MMKKYILIKIFFDILVGLVLTLAFFLVDAFFYDLSNLWTRLILSSLPVLVIFSIIYGIAYIRNYSYEFSEKKLILRKGIFRKIVEYYPIDKIQNIEFSQSFVEKSCRLCELKVTNAGDTATIKYVDQEKGQAIAEKFKMKDNQK